MKSPSANAALIVERHEERIVEALCQCVIELARSGDPEPELLMRKYVAALVESIKAAAGAAVNPSARLSRQRRS